MKNKLFNFSVVIVLSFFVFAPLLTQAKTTKNTKTVVVKKVVVSSKASKAKVKAVKTTKKSKVTSKPVAHAFSATEASQSTSYSGKLPPAGYMEALKKAEDDFMTAKAQAHGNKAKLDAAVAQYDQALNEAQQLLN